MNISILFVSLLFFSSSHIVLSSQETTMTTSKYYRDPRIRRPKFRPVNPFEVRTLIPLAAAISEFIATYKRPLSTKPYSFKFVHWRRTTREKIITNRTKYMTKRFYPTKKKYPLKSERRAIIYKHFLNTLSLFDERKKELLTGSRKKLMLKTNCYLNVFSTFMDRCQYAYFLTGGMKKMKKLLAQACEASWLTTDGIIRIIQRCCRGRFKYKHIQTA